MSSPFSTILVTGGLGFAGSAMIRYLMAETNAQIVNLDKLGVGVTLEGVKKHIGNVRYHFVRGDLCDQKLVDGVFQTYCPDVVFHYAAESSVDTSIANPRRTFQCNGHGMFNLLEAARTYHHLTRRQHFRLVVASSVEVYGDLGTKGQFTEDSPLVPNSPFGASKAAADIMALTWWRTFELPVVIARCSSAFGPHQCADRFIPRVIMSGLESLPIPIYGDGDQTRDWMFVLDYAQMMLKCASLKPGSIINLGTGTEMTILQVAREICDILDKTISRRYGHASLIRHVPDRPAHDWRVSLDLSKMESLGIKSEFRVDRALQNTVRFYVERCFDKLDIFHEKPGVQLALPSPKDASTVSITKTVA